MVLKLSISGKADIRKIIGYVTPFVLMVVFLYIAFKDVDFDVVVNQLKGMSLLWLGIFIVTFLLSHFLRAVRWKYILNSVKEDTSIWNLWGALMVGYGVNLAIPRLGELYRALFGGKWEGLSRSSMLGTIIVERILDVLFLLLAVIFSVILYPGDLYKEFVWLKLTVYIGMAFVAAAFIVIVLVIRLKEKFYNIIVRFIGRFSKTIASKLGYMFGMFADGFASLKGTKNYIFVFTLSAMIMLLYGLNSMFGFYLVDLDGAHQVTYAMGWILMTISAFGIVFPTPGGFGSFHAITIAVLVQLYNYSAEEGAAYALAVHTISTTIFILSTVASIWLVNRRQKSLGKDKQNFINVFKIDLDEQ